jgi:zinc-ribbon domain
MSKLGLNEFMEDSKKGGDGGGNEHLNLKQKGKAIVFLHPDSGIYKRTVYWMPVYGEVEENGKQVFRTYNTMVVCPGSAKNPIAKLREALRENEDIDNDEVVLVVGKKKEKKEFTKGDILGAKGYDWQKSLAYKIEYLFGVVDKDNAKSVQVLVAPKSLGKKVTKVIEDQIEEEGEEDGNPFKNPYAFKLTFDKDASSPNEMYNAVWNKAEPSEEVQELLEGDGPDNKPLTEPTDVAKIAYLVREALVLDSDDLGLDLSAADDFDPEDLKRKKDKDDDDEKSNKKDKKADKKKPSKKDPEDDDDDDNQEEDPEPKPKKPKKDGKKPDKKKPSKKDPEPEDDDDDEVEMIDCPECGEEIPADSETCPECGEDVSPF